VATPAKDIIPADAKTLVLEVGGYRVLAMDSVSFADAGDAGHVIVTGSHGGVSAGEYAAGVKPLLAVCNDAGVGKNAAGVAGMQALADLDIAALTVAHTSARIGDGMDVWTSGRVSYVNPVAARAGFAVGDRLSSAVETYLRRLAPRRPRAAANGEGR
jgi:hypothetical protein